MAIKSMINGIMVCIAIIAVTRVANAEAPIPNSNGKLVMLCKTLNNCIDKINSSISLKYRYSGPDGDGQDFLLKNGASLYNNDRFTLEVTVHKSVYLYLFYVDSSGTIQELLHQAEKSNYVIAGQILMLPGSELWSSFGLDEVPGIETIYPIVSSHKRDELIQIHGQKNVRNLIVICECGDPCREPFIIRHLEKN